MATEIAAIQAVPKLGNGLTPLLSKHLGFQDLAKHKATLALELEVLAKKFDRFGWERDREKGSAAQDRMILDWMEALKDYPLDEVSAACRAAVLSNPNKMPNEGHVIAQIEKARLAFLASQPKPIEAPKVERKGNPEGSARILSEVGVSLKRAATQKAGKVLDVRNDDSAQLPKQPHWTEGKAPDSASMQALRRARVAAGMITAGEAQ